MKLENMQTILESSKMKFKTFINNNNASKTKVKTLDIPEINVTECELLRMDHKDHTRFEYDMIKRARDAEIMLNQILYNDPENTKSTNTNTVATAMSTLLWKLKSSSHHIATDIPSIRIEDYENEEKDEEELEEEMLKSANEALKLWQTLIEYHDYSHNRRGSLTLHLSQSDPILSETTKQSRLNKFYMTLTKRRSRTDFSSITCNSITLLNSPTKEDSRKRKLFSRKSSS